MLSEGEGTVTPELVLAGLIAAVRTDDHEEDRSSRDVHRIARARRRKLGLLAFGAGPLRGIAGQVVELYCEIAVLFDVASLHSMPLGDREATAHMLAIWGLASDSSEAAMILDGSSGRSLTQIMAARLTDAVASYADLSTKRGVLEALFNVRAAFSAGKAVAAKGSLKDVVFAGHQTKQVIHRAERQLGIAGVGSRASARS